MFSLSRRGILKTGFGALPAMAVAKPMAAFGQACGPAISTPTTLRQIATGCHVPDTEYPGVPAVAFRSPHFNRAGLTLNSLQIAVPNRYGLSAPRSPKTWRARIEYPLNVVTEVTWNGGAHDVTTENPPANSHPFVLSDTVTLQQPIPDNAMFWVRLWEQDSTASALLCQNIGNYSWDPQNPISAALGGRTINKALGETNSAGDWSLLDNPVLQDPSQNNRWSFSDGGGGIYSGVVEWATVRPLAILGQSRKPAFSLWGDSRVCGIGDVFDGVSDDRGEVERSIGPAYAYINFGVPGLPAATLNGLFSQVPAADYNPWLYFGNFTTNMIEDLGGADCLNYALQNHQPIDANALSAILALKKNIWSSWTGLGKSSSSLSTLTLPPYTNSDAADRNASLKTLTDALRAGVLDSRGNQVRVIDIASIVALVNSAGQYVWSCPDYAVDTLHESQAGCYAIHDSGIINPYALTV